MAAHGQVAAEFTRFRFAVDGAQRLAVHQQDALIALTDLGQKRLDHHRQLLLLRDQLQQGSQPGGLPAGADHPLTSAPTQGLQHHLPMGGCKLAQQLHIAGHQGGGHQLRELQRTQFFVPGPQAGRAVEHLHALALSQLKQVGGIEVGLIHGWVFAHPHPLEVAEGLPTGFPRAVPRLSGDRRGQHAGTPFSGCQVAGLSGPDLLAGPLAGLHQRNAAVFFRAQAPNRINQEKLAPHAALAP